MELEGKEEWQHRSSNIDNDDNEKAKLARIFISPLFFRMIKSLYNLHIFSAFLRIFTVSRTHRANQANGKK